MQAKIHVGDLNCKIRGADKTEAIAKARSYFKMGRDSYSRRQNKNIPKYRYMVTAKGTFKTGMLSYVVDYLSKKGFDVEVKNKKTVQHQPTPEQVNEGLDFVPYTLRPYQREALAHGVCEKNGIFNMATGAGKTVILASLISVWWQENTLILIDSVDLAKQLQEEISEIIDYEVGFIGNGIFNPKRVTVGIDMTLLASRCGARKEKKIKDYMKSVNHLIFDECHHLQSNTWRKLARRCKNASIRHGFSATPITASYETLDGDIDNKNLYLYAYAGPIIYEKTLSELVDKGWLAEPKVNIVQHDLYWDNNPLSNYPEEYERIVIKDEERNDKVAKIAKKHFRRDEQVVGFVDRLEHGKRIKHKLRDEYDIGKRGVAFVSGQSASRWRDQKIEEFKDGSLPILIGTVLEEGLNFFCDAGINIAGNKFEKTIYQRMGRCLRKSSTDSETGDIDPTVYESIDWYDFADSEHKWFQKQANQRLEAYMKEDLDVSIIKEGEL